MIHHITNVTSDQEILRTPMLNYSLPLAPCLYKYCSSYFWVTQQMLLFDLKLNPQSSYKNLQVTFKQHGFVQMATCDNSTLNRLTEYLR
jgi:hypothetical protein